MLAHALWLKTFGQALGDGGGGGVGLGGRFGPGTRTAGIMPALGPASYMISRTTHTPHHDQVAFPVRI